ncbi:hypothetical protein BJV78DRAFT_1247388, partial [Lactifluus subvellereus]
MLLQFFTFGYLLSTAGFSLLQEVAVPHLKPESRNVDFCYFNDLLFQVVDIDSGGHFHNNGLALVEKLRIAIDEDAKNSRGAGAGGCH